MTATTMRPPRPPGPSGTLLGGNLPDFRRDRLAFMTRCNREYGDVVALRLGPRRVYLVTHPEPIEEVLVHQARNFIKHFALRMNPLVLGKGLLTSEGDFWLRQRRLIQPAFLPSRIAAYAPAVAAACRRLIDSWQPGETRDLLADMKRLTLDVTAAALFGAEVGEEARAVTAALQVLQDNFIARFNSLVPPPLWLPTPRTLRFRRSLGRLDAIVYDFIRRRRAADSGRSDLLSILLRARDEDDGGRMTDRQVRDEAMTLFLAGHETTALALSWTLFLLAGHADVDARLAAEARNVLGTRPATADDSSRLGYAAQVVQEAMRLYPPVYAFGREALADCTVAGFHVPAGMTLLMSPWVVHRDPRWYDRPDEFRPERWSGDAARTLPRFAYFPFGGGPRLCIGNTFAMMELVLALATIARDFRVTLEPGQTVAPVASFTLRPSTLRGTILRRAENGNE